MKRVVVDQFGGPEVLKGAGARRGRQGRDRHAAARGRGRARMFGTCSARDKAAVERLGAEAIDYRNEDFLARVRELTDGEGGDVVLDGIGGRVALRAFRALRKGNSTGSPRASR